MLRAEYLYPHRFGSLRDARQIVESRRSESVESRPHWALGKRTHDWFSVEFAAGRNFTRIQTTES